MWNLIDRIRSLKSSGWGSGRARAKRAFWACYRGLSGCPGFPVDIGGTGKFYVHTDFAFAGFEYWGNRHNNGFRRLVEISRRGSVVLDVGAHVGLCTLPLSRAVGPRGLVVAFEPSATNYAFLRSHIRFNQLGNVTTVACLVGDRPAEAVDFYESRTPTGMNSIVRYKDLDKASWTTRTQITIDDYCRTNKLRPHVIKIDVEGAEAGVLRGAVEVLRESRPIVILSLHPRHIELTGESVSTVLGLIESLHYSIYDMDGQKPSGFALQEYVLEPTA